MVCPSVITKSCVSMYLATSFLECNYCISKNENVKCVEAQGSHMKCEKSLEVQRSHRNLKIHSRNSRVMMEVKSSEGGQESPHLL